MSKTRPRGPDIAAFKAEAEQPDQAEHVIGDFQLPSLPACNGERGTNLRWGHPSVKDCLGEVPLIDTRVWAVSDARDVQPRYGRLVPGAGMGAS